MLTSHHLQGIHPYITARCSLRPAVSAASALLFSHFLDFIHVHGLPSAPIQNNLLYSRNLLLLLVVLNEDAQFADVGELHKPVQHSQQWTWQQAVLLSS